MSQNLLYSSDIISIERWKQISLLLKVKVWVKLLTLNNIAYISNFPLNLISFGCLLKHGFDWSYYSGKLLKNNQTIGYTQFYDNNHEISNDKIGEIAFATLIMYPATLKTSLSYKKPYSATILDTWHRRIGHISPLELHILDKKCFEVWLQSKKMSQCTYYAVFKIFQQISH